jgi:hypothetical protein
MRRALALLLLCGLAACGSSAIQGTLAWREDPMLSVNRADGSRTASGFVRNTTSHSVTLDAKSMRLLDADGRKVRGRVRVGAASVAPHATARLRATWKSGKPVRIDYGTGTLALPST